MIYGLQIRESDGKCRAISNSREPLTGWCKDGMKVQQVMRLKRRKLKEKGDGG